MKKYIKTILYLSGIIIADIGIAFALYAIHTPLSLRTFICSLFFSILCFRYQNKIFGDWTMKNKSVKEKVIKIILEIINFIFAFAIAACVAYTLSNLNAPQAVIGGISAGVICFCLMGFDKLFIQ